MRAAKILLVNLIAIALIVFCGLVIASEYKRSSAGNKCTAELIKIESKSLPVKSLTLLQCKNGSRIVF